MSKIYLISTQEIKDNSIIESNVDAKLINHTLLNVQDTILEPLLTEELYNKILQGVKDSSLTEDYRTLIKDRIHPVLIAGVVLHISDNLIYKYSAMGVNKEKADSDETISHREHGLMKKEKERILMFHSNKLQDYLNKNRAKFPEYESDQQQSEDGLDIGIWLG